MASYCASYWLFQDNSTESFQNDIEYYEGEDSPYMFY